MAHSFTLGGNYGNFCSCFVFIEYDLLFDCYFNILQARINVTHLSWKEVWILHQWLYRVHSDSSYFLSICYYIHKDTWILHSSNHCSIRKFLHNPLFPLFQTVWFRLLIWTWIQQIQRLLALRTIIYKLPCDILSFNNFRNCFSDSDVFEKKWKRWKIRYRTEFKKLKIIIIKKFTFLFG